VAARSPHRQLIVVTGPLPHQSRLARREL